MSKSDDFPQLRDGEYAILCLERATRIVLAFDGSRALPEDETYRVFMTVEDAVRSAKEILAVNTNWEVVLLDSRGEEMRIYQSEKYRPPSLHRSWR